VIATAFTGEQVMTDKDVERNSEGDYVPGPWWAGLGPRGAVVLIVLGVLAAAWAGLASAMGLGWLPFTSEDLAIGSYQAAKVVAIGLVILVSALLGRRRARDADTVEADEAEHD
jgi:hypothetical protein